MPMQHSLDMELITAAARYADENRSRRNIHTNPEGVIGHARTDSSISPDVPTPPTGTAAGTGAAATEAASHGTEAVVDDETNTATGNPNDPVLPNTAKAPATDAAQNHQ
ncbi:hypothetical protein MGYG_06363 [Nannizzia gypsea CBS 118893]|uniref:Uncharacterized protein n=1 Tax=Arthroderma gypseum (strain ATCC MYA-4604 / CBS 118893) TaxID=535722 RepID=E4UZ35_ARTGP|nr:hypothetical protein MGYG_06363 [Nannizzia gypsea CBS 118893]EFR03365.1 hypothetical protein MGYG_06363 [Nannizzia gypsea CBS 118893]